MAFVAFGKKVINTQQQELQISQQLQQQQQLRSNESFMATSSYQQQPFADARTTQSIAHSDLEGFRLAEADTEMVFRDGPRDEALLLGFEPPANAPREQLLDAEADGISQLLEHNNALRRNFDKLKQLHLQLAEANAQLQEAFLSIQAEKARVEGGLEHHTALQHEMEVLEAELEEMKIKHAKELELSRAEREEISGLAVELELRNMSLEKKVAIMKGDNKELNHKLEVVRYGHDDRSGSQLLPTQMLRLEKEQALNNKHAAEIEYTRGLSLVKVEDQNYRQQAADLAHKCKHLEIDLEKSISAGEAVHQQLVALTYEKDAVIMDLEQALRRLKDDLQGLERKRNDNERSWQDERYKLQAIVDEKEREEFKLRLTMHEETEQKLKESFREILELRTSLNSLQKSSATAEAQNLESLKETKKECDTLRNELGAALAVQKDAADRLIDLERLRVQLGDALAQNHESVSQIAEYRKTRDELQRKMELMRIEIAEAVAARGKEQAEHKAKLENLQRKWAEEKSALLRREDKLIKTCKTEFSLKYRALKKRSKHTSKLLATMTVEHNQLIIRMRECEAQLAIAQTTRFHTAVGSAPSTSRTSLKVEDLNRGSFEADMKELADRQAKFLVHSPQPLSSKLHTERL